MKKQHFISFFIIKNVSATSVWTKFHFGGIKK